MAQIEFSEVMAQDGGLAFILDRLPQARGTESAKGTGKKFKFREGEKTASASLKLVTEKGYWIVTDFGGDSKGMHAVALTMELDRCDFVTALHTVSAFYNVSAASATSGPRAEYNERPASKEEQDGTWKVIPKELTEEALKTVFVTSAWQSLASKTETRMKKAIEICSRYHLKLVDTYWVIKEGKYKEWKSTDEFPIFFFDEGDWGKIYQPKAEKKWRFRYLGKKPARFIHGLEAAQAFCVGKDLTDKKNQLNEKLASGTVTQAEHKSLMVEIMDDESAKKLPELIMCSGGSDALNTAAMGYWVLWRNSETEELNYPEHKKIMEVCNTLYNLPDIDETGKLAGHKLALQFLDMKTIWLPERMLDQRDSEGKPRHKDLRDFLRLHSQEEPGRTHNKYDFDQLVKTALPYQFWDEHQETDSDGNPKFKFGRPIMKYAVNNLRLYNFLHRCGFGRLEDKAEKTKYTYIRVDKNIVKSIEPSAIKDFVNEFLESRAAVEDLRNTFYRSPHLSEGSFSNLPLLKLEFKGHAADRQYLFFENATWKITADKIEEVKQETSGKNVWESKVLQIPGTPKIRIDEPYFKIVKKEDGWDIDILNKNIPFLNFLIQTSRVHWREELEYRLDFFNSFDNDRKRQDYAERHELSVDMLKLMNSYQKAENQSEYKKQHLFSIDGPLLKTSEIREQKLFLINRLFCIGYILHRHKFKSKPWAVFAMDNRLSEDGVANGGAGKSIVTDALQLVLANKIAKERHIEMIKGRSDTINTYDFVFEGITTKTDMVLIDDVSPSMDFKVFYEPLTSDWKINRRNRGYETLMYSDSPKVWFNSNYGDKFTEGSDTRRKLVTAYSDYYHDNPHGFYRERRTPENDFKKQLFEDWNQEEWMTFYNLAAQCVQFFLTTGDQKIEPPTSNITKRNLLTEMGENFLAWADVFFDEKEGKVNQLVIKDEAREDFQKSSNFNKMTSQAFMNRLKAWAAYRGHTLNPEELKNKDGRIVRKPLNYEIVKEMIYVQTAGVAVNVSA